MCRLSRRAFLARTASCAGYLAATGAAIASSRALAWARQPTGEIVARERFGHLEQVADGVWALVSNPLEGDRTTLCNGGLVRGRDGVLAIEGFMDPRGAAWLAARARELTGRAPTHVVLTHYHADHTNGVAGYGGTASSPVVRVTASTRDQAIARNQPADAARTDTLTRATVLDAQTNTIDLGGRVVKVLAHRGHTDSDIALELEEPNVVFCGDLVWNGMFPNYVDASPLRLSEAVRALRRGARTLYVPGHGAVAREPDVDRYVAVLEHVEQAARQAHAQGQSAAEAASRFALPATLGGWVLFNPAFFERAFTAWYRDLEAARR